MSSARRPGVMANFPIFAIIDNDVSRKNNRHMTDEKQAGSSHSDLVIYKASAGSGKTFTLSVEYIEMMLRDITSYKRTLAVTFTNKATVEMKTRILSQLYGLANGLESSASYRAVLKERNPGFTDDFITSRAQMALTCILGDYSNFRVETIDSFFQRVLKQLAHELRLSTSFNIELDSGRALDEAIDALLENLHNDRQLLQVVLRYIEERMTDDRSWRVESGIKSFSRHIFDETYAARKVNPSPETIEVFKKMLLAQKECAQQSIAAVVETFDKMLSDAVVAVEDFKNGSRGPCGFFVKLKNGVMADDKFSGKTYREAATDPEKWTSKKSPAAARDLAPRLMKLMYEADTVRQKASRIINTADLALRDLNNLSLLDNISRTLQRQNDEKNRFLLADTNNMLREMIGSDDPSFIYEKLGSRIDHIMIDEFQDTSSMQWENFSKLLREGLAAGKRSLIVGDVKQSIYRWRGGDWNILNSQIETDIIPFACDVRTLATNRRSEENIIRFNNALFPVIVGNLEYPKLKQAYMDVCQDVPSSRMSGKGYVKVVQFGVPSDTGSGDKQCKLSNDEYKQETLAAMVDEIKDLLSNGLPQKDICILVRRRASMHDIAGYMAANLPEATLISDEAFNLSSSGAVGIIIAALRYLNDRSDEVSLAKLALCGCDVDKWNDILLSHGDGGTSAHLPVSFIARYDELRAMPLYEVVVNIIDIFDIYGRKDEQAYISTFMDLLKETMRDGVTDITTFLGLWDERLSSRAISANADDGIRIMTIHKSKGLQAHTVLIPFCDWTLTTDARKDNIVWCDNPYSDFKDKLAILPVNYSKAMGESQFSKDYDTETEQMVVDNINLLYVALTRAEKNLVIFTREKTGTIGEKLTVALSSGSLESIAISVLPTFELGNKIYESKEKSSDGGDNPFADAPADLHCETMNTPVRIRFRQSNKSARFMRHGTEEQQTYIDRGIVMHLLFSSLRTGSEVEIDRAIADIEHEGLIDDVKQKAAMRDLAIKRVAWVKDYGWFDSSNRLYNECELIYRNEDGVLEQCRPDRVMVNRRTVTVVDFKFGKQKDEYREQVERYKRLLARVELPGTPVEGRVVKGYLWYVYDNNIIEV